ncbi:MAG: hypothetical protein ACRD0U_08885 [Acidimicrobiales bacterium]
MAAAVMNVNKVLDGHVIERAANQHCVACDDQLVYLGQSGRILVGERLVEPPIDLLDKFAVPGDQWTEDDNLTLLTEKAARRRRPPIPVPEC